MADDTPGLWQEESNDPWGSGWPPPQRAKRGKPAWMSSKVFLIAALIAISATVLSIAAYLMAGWLGGDSKEETLIAEYVEQGAVDREERGITGDDDQCIAEELMEEIGVEGFERHLPLWEWYQEAWGTEAGFPALTALREANDGISTILLDAEESCRVGYGRALYNPGRRSDLGTFVADLYWSEDGALYYVVIGGVRDAEYCEVYTLLDGERTGAWGRGVRQDVSTEVLISIPGPPTSVANIEWACN